MNASLIAEAVLAAEVRNQENCLSSGQNWVFWNIASHAKRSAGRPVYFARRALLSSKFKK
jgi:hypothetical protein